MSEENGSPVQEFSEQESESGFSSETVGGAAGRVWQYLESNGLTSLIRLKSELSCAAGLTHLALGWLLREGKIELIRDKGHLFVKLK